MNKGLLLMILVISMSMLIQMGQCQFYVDIGRNGLPRIGKRAGDEIESSGEKYSLYQLRGDPVLLTLGQRQFIKDVFEILIELDNQMSKDEK
jgi:hypothetical protein